MRDFRDAKAMARSLRDALTAKSVQATHSESLELIAKAFGYDNWNILSAKIDAARPPSSWPGKMPNQESQGQLLYCSFCGKNQHEVNKLVAGPAVYICDGCIDLCTDIVDEHLLCLIDGDREAARALSTDRLQHYVVHAERGAQRNRLALQRIERVLAVHENRSATDSEISGLASFAQLKHNTPDELRAMQSYAQAQLKSYEQALRTAMAILGERSRANSPAAARLAKTEIADAGESDQHQRPG